MLPWHLLGKAEAIECGAKTKPTVAIRAMIELLLMLMLVTLLGHFISFFAAHWK
jgi:hypothetical protein